MVESCARRRNEFCFRKKRKKKDFFFPINARFFFTSILFGRQKCIFLRRIEIHKSHSR